MVQKRIWKIGNFFLKSDQGGMWEDCEIAVMQSSPSWSEVLYEINSCCDVSGEPYFLFLAFSGHGAYDLSRQKDVIFLNDKEIVEVDSIVSAIKAITNNAIIVIDACRKKCSCVQPLIVNDFTDATQLNFILESVERKNLPQFLLESRDRKKGVLDYLTYDKSDLRACYLLFVMEKLKKCMDESGPILIQSCSIDEYANEIGYGLFSEALMWNAVYWYQLNKMVPASLNVSDAFDAASKRLNKILFVYNKRNGSNEIQSPQISCSKSILPISIDVKQELEKKLQN